MGNQVSFCDSEAPSATTASAAVETKPTTVKLSPEEVEAVKEELLQEYVSKVVSEEGDSDLIIPEVVTAPYDPRFPSTNQSRHCFVRYNEYYKCVYERGADNDRCQFYKRAYETLCPSEWLEDWQTQREQGIWPGKY